MTRYLKQVSYSVSIKLPDKLRRKLDLIFQREKYENVSELMRELLEEASNQRILQMSPKVSEDLNS